MRGLSRYFMQETGMTLAHLKQLANLLTLLQKLNDQKSVTEIAY